MDFSPKNLLKDFHPVPGRNIEEAMQTMRAHRLKTAIPEVAPAVSQFKNEALSGHVEYPLLKKSFFSGYHAVRETFQSVVAMRLTNDSTRMYVEDALEEIRHGLKGLKNGVKAAGMNDDHSAEIVFWRSAAVRLNALSDHMQMLHDKHQRLGNKEINRAAPAGVTI